MKRIFALLFVLLSSGCATQHAGKTVHGPVGFAAAPAQTRAATPRSVGSQAVADINTWYNATDKYNCGSAQRPAYLCSGVMLRATENNAAFLPWNPNPSSTGVSFSWMRRDVNFGALVYNYWNGFIFYPKDSGAPGANVINVLCSFVMDSATLDRGENGCGATPGVGGSEPCDRRSPPVVDAPMWNYVFDLLPANKKYSGQCGWTVPEGGTSAAGRFIQMAQARQSMAQQYWTIQDELRMSLWPQNSRVPIRAFFYVAVNAGALANAQDDQRRFAADPRQGNAFVPIIRMTLPTSKNGVATFTYSSADQVVPDPGF